jgi:hypothetical protein
MKRRELLKLIREAAKLRGIYVTHREGGSHTVLTVGSSRVSVPRHREITSGTLRIIVRILESELGEDWLQQ